MSFADDIARFTLTVEATTKQHFVNIAAAVKDSITDGSPVTGAPGQPVNTGALKNSWQLAFDSPTSARISTKMAYAEAIEDGVGPHGPLTLRSAVGGFYSVRLTAAGFPKLVASVVAGGA